MTEHLLHGSQRRGVADVGAWIWFSALALAIYLGYRNRAAGYVTPEHGMGYWLGIVGGSAMLVLLLYPLRKKARWLRHWGPVRYWFRIHMLLGAVAPVLILFHANFQLGSLNSRVALYTMLLVAVSGLFGRYIYRQVHDGLYGHRISLQSLRDNAVETRAQILRVLATHPGLDQRLQRLEQRLQQPPGSVFSALARLFVMGGYIRLLHLGYRFHVRRLVRQRTRERNWTSTESRSSARRTRKLLAGHMRLLVNIAEFSFYERLLRLWHLLHFPLFLLMVLAGVLHVVAVHMY